MKTPILIGIWAALVLGAAKASAEQHSASPGEMVDRNLPETIACAQERGEALRQCSYRVKRDETGKTTVTVIFANGFGRGLIFENGQFVKASVTMSGVGTDTEWRLEDGKHMIEVDGQRYEVPDILIPRD
ncbi:hypothetical protein FIU86_02950 [Roseovarius sp. THAF9]|uniref:hypothetical protein n=1 Tax=Roseovarius sp. THAF9 TaxID=2587847 RepID=UPI001268DE64|nr:hypothetical protein [Roseovarius sp. THAF9]QFT91784.1 hypothetical protein FIU86_02950 [Roseovarius sp. THAF9]